jgi:hypothetical protein
MGNINFNRGAIQSRCCTFSSPHHELAVGGRFNHCADNTRDKLMEDTENELIRPYIGERALNLVVGVKLGS